MKKNKVIYVSLLLSALSLTSCAGKLQLFDRDDYNSNGVAYFAENYYQEWSPSFNPAGGARIETKTFDVAKKFTSWNDHNFHSFDRLNPVKLKQDPIVIEDMQYNIDTQTPDDRDNGKYFGPTMKMSRYIPDFKYGITSKLFDGYIFCNGYGTMHRIQVMANKDGKNNGFGFEFPLELNLSNMSSITVPYIALNYKGATNTNDEGVLWDVMPTLDLYFSLYERSSDANYDYTEYRMALRDIITYTDIGDNHDKYNFAGFYLDELPEEMLSKRVIGFGLSYDLISPPDNAAGDWKDATSLFGLFAYELFLPTINWM